MKKTYLIIISLFVLQINFAQNTDAEFLKIEKEYTLHEDGSIDYHYSKELKLLSHYAFHRLYGETFIIYNTDFQSLKINSAYTTMADGKKVVTPENAFNEVLPRFSTDAPAYNNIREMVVTHTGLEVGTTIFLDYTITSKSGFFPALMADDILSESSPVQELIIKIKVPESKELKFELLNIKGEPTVSNNQGKKVYTWVFKSLPATSKDYYQVLDQTDLPRLIFSSADNMEAVCQQFLDQDAFDLKTDERMNNMVDKVLSENIDHLSVALELQKQVTNNLKGLTVPLKYHGYICRTPVETWKSNQGTRLEKTLLLASLLKEANINAVPVAVLPNEYFKTELGNLCSFNSFLLKMELADYGEVYLSAYGMDKQNQAFNLAGKTLISLDKSTPEINIITGQKMANKIKVTGELNFADCGHLKARMHLILENNSNPYFKLFKDASALKNVVKGGLSSKDVKSSKVTQLGQKKSISDLEINKEKPFTELSNYLSLELPVINKGVDSWHINLLNAERTSALGLPENIDESYSYSIQVPESFKLVSKPNKTEIKNNAGYLLFELTESDGKIIVSKKIIFDKSVITPDIYADFKAIMDVWNNSNNKKIIFKK